MDGVVVVIRDGDEYLMIQDASGKFKGSWSPVHGSLEEGETPEEAGIREVQEEVNLKVELSPGDKITTTTADYKTDNLHWYLTEGYSGDIQVEEREISDHEWMSLNQIEQKELLPQAENFFQDYMPQR
jgi:NTP pyrophosphohydrolases containing a Zn-finger, probably nucleic-acid-binding|nr:MAG: NTP pyrophosphohydrolase, Zn-finger domain protein [Candidatus Nanosalinarum sp. J07AB56]